MYTVTRSQSACEMLREAGEKRTLVVRDASKVVGAEDIVEIHETLHVGVCAAERSGKG